MATIYYAGTSLADLSANGGAVLSTNASHVSTAVCREGINLANGPVFAQIDLTSGLSELWFSCRFIPTAFPGAANAFGMIEFYDTSVSTSQALFRLNHSNTWSTASSLLWQYWNGSAWTTIGSGATPVNAISNFTAHIKIDDTVGVADAFYAGGTLATMSGDTKFTSSTTIDRVKFYTEGTSVSWTLSEIVIADSDTRDYRVAALYPTANGANTAWSNDYTNVDETGATDTDYISSSSNGDVETYTITDIDASVSTNDVAAVVLSIRGRKGATGPQNIQGVVRISGSDYASSSVAGLTSAFGPVQAIWHTNPATASNWTQTVVNGMEAGVKAIT